MHEHFTSGAINKATLEYLFPSIASKENKYSCPHCKNDVTLRKGKVRVHHFAHKKEVSTCTYYTKPTRKHIIYDLKMALHTIYNTKRQPIWFMNKCINKNCGTETISVLSQNSMTCPILRFDKSSNYIVFENTQLQSREEIIKEVEYNYEKSIENVEKNLIIKQIQELELSTNNISSIATPFQIRSIFDMENKADEMPTTRTDLRISEEDIEELNSMLKKSLSQWKVHISKSRAVGTVYFYNKKNNVTTWNTPSEVLREEEILLINRKMDKIKALKQELSTIENTLQMKINEDIESTTKEQEQKRVILLEITHDDDNDYLSRLGTEETLESIKIPGLGVNNDHKHLIVSASNLMEKYKTYMMEDVAKGTDSSCNEDNEPSPPSIKHPFKLQCSVFKNYTCNSCINKKLALKQKEDMIRKLFYKKFPIFSVDHPEISYRTTNSPPTVRQEEAKQRKRILLRRMREHQKYIAFRENYLMEERQQLLSIDAIDSSCV